jgi:hypothetical protein
MENQQSPQLVDLTNMEGTGVTHDKTEQALQQGCSSVQRNENNDAVNEVGSNLNKAIKMKKNLSSKHRPPMLTNFRRTFSDSISPVAGAMEKSAG